jgi:capsular polysaccharide biosynthesis protein
MLAARCTFLSLLLPPQVAAAQSSCLIAGAHGAGLTHVLFAPPGVRLLEIRPPAFQRPHFIAYAFWAGAHHDDWRISTSAPPPDDVVVRVANSASLPRFMDWAKDAQR